MKQFIVLGLGTFGRSLAVTLSRKGLDVIAVDRAPDRVDEVKQDVGHTLILDILEGGEGLQDFLEEGDTVAIVNLGDTLEANILAIHYLTGMGVGHILVKTVNQLHASLYLKMGADEVINPEEVAGANLADRLVSPNLIDTIPLSPEHGIYELALPDSLVGKSIRDIDFRKKYKLEIIALKNVLEDTLTVMPDPDMPIPPDSAALCICRKTDFERIRLT